MKHTALSGIEPCFVGTRILASIPVPNVTAG